MFQAQAQSVYTFLNIMYKFARFNAYNTQSRTDTHRHIITHVCAHALTHTHTQTHTHTHMRAHAHTHTHTHTL